MKLKKCPYCGKEEICTELNFDNGEARIHCSRCPAEMRFLFADYITEYCLGTGRLMSLDDLEDFIRYCAEAWNRRSE